MVPVAHDAGKSWPRKGFIKYPGVIKLVIGEMIDSKGMSASEVNEKVYQWMEAQMTQLEGQKPEVKEREVRKRG